MSRGWIGVDFDGTLAHYDRWRGVDHVGEPIDLMCDRVRAWLDQGREVKIFTARVAGTPADESMERITAPIDKFCLEQFGMRLEVTNVKDMGMIELWDDRAVSVEHNTGRVVARNTNTDPTKKET